MSGGRIELVAAAGKPRGHMELLVYGNIGDGWSGDSVLSATVVRELAAARPASVLVRINSHGGTVADGVAIFNALRSCGAEITTRVEGTAASIASLIFMAGDVREIGDNCTIMVHAPWGTVAGNAGQLRDAASVLEKIAASMAASYARSGKTFAQALALLADGKDHWYTASEAKREGFATNIVGIAADNRYALAALARYPGAPSAAMAAHGATPKPSPWDHLKPGTAAHAARNAPSPLWSQAIQNATADFYRSQR